MEEAEWRCLVFVRQAGAHQAGTGAIRLARNNSRLPQLLRSQAGVKWPHHAGKESGSLLLDGQASQTQIRLDTMIMVHESNGTPRNTGTDYSPITYSHPSSPIQTSCSFPAGTSTRAPTPKVSFLTSPLCSWVLSSGYVMVRLPRRMRWVVTPAWEWAG